MKIYKITQASEYLGVSINTLKTLANNVKINSFKTTGSHRRFRQEDLDALLSKTRSMRKAFHSVPIDDETANAVAARSLEDIADSFADVERRDRIVRKVLIGPLAFADMMRQNQHDVESDDSITLWGAKVELVNDGLLVVWDERAISSVG